MLCFLLLGFLFSYLSADFYDNQNVFNAQSVLNTFDIDTSYQADPALFTQHYEKTIGDDWEKFIESYDKGYNYIPILKQMLNDAEVPQEFLYLAMAESRFSTRAYSVKKAVGIWQIMPATAKSLGLRIDDFIDERRDPIKSTQAAIKYLKQLKSITGKWYLAAMAYNCGIGRLQRAIKEAGSDDISVLMNSSKNYIPIETQHYIRIILSMNVAFSDVNTLKTLDKEYFLNRGTTTTLASVKVPSGTDFNSIAKSAGISIDDLKSYNRQFKYNFIPPNGGEYDVYLPYEYLLAFKTNFKPKKVDLSKFYIVYKVKKGDSLYSISRKYSISIETLKNTNNIKKTLLSINQKLIIPLKQINQKLAYKAK
ncbi:lytic transglycosylase [Helicobacter sp. MIT 14-3879]|nr:lytic transglycosylase [Helicobacter sp. MIT 14-3879]